MEERLNELQQQLKTTQNELFYYKSLVEKLEMKLNSIINITKL